VVRNLTLFFLFRERERERVRLRGEGLCRLLLGNLSTYGLLLSLIRRFKIRRPRVEYLFFIFSFSSCTGRPDRRGRSRICRLPM